MTDEKTVTESQLNAFVDNELDDNEQVEILNLINENPELLQTANEIRHDMDMVALAYRNLPVKNSIVKLSDRKGVTPIRYAAMAAGVFLALGVISGWLVSSYTEQNSRPVFTTVDNFKPETSRAEKILIHVSTRDENRVSRALSKLEEILEASEDSQNHVQLKFVANAEGLAVLRENSPYADRIKLLSEQYSNVEFLACGIAMKTAQLKEKKEVVLLPEAKKIPAALNEILERLEAGWTYMGS